MSNNFYNFQIPYFNELYGTDWDDFNDIVEDNTDYLMQRTYDLYRLGDINRVPRLAIDYILQSYGLTVSPTDSLVTKRTTIRNLSSNFENKGLEDFYLDPIETIVTIRGEIYSWVVFGYFRDSYSRWPDPTDPQDSDWRWATSDGKFDIYINVKTEDDDLLDEIETLLALKYMEPAFYNIYLVNDDLDILRGPL